jgi:anti-anti-sigma factor
MGMESTSPSSGPARIAFVQGIPVVEVIGRLDVASAPLFDEQTAPLFTQHRARVLIDMSGTAYISSAGLRSILKVIKLCASGGGRVGVFAITPPILEILEISGFQTLMDVYPDRETALKECVAAS